MDKGFLSFEARGTSFAVSIREILCNEQCVPINRLWGVDDTRRNNMYFLNEQTRRLLWLTKFFV